MYRLDINFLPYSSMAPIDDLTNKVNAMNDSKTTHATAEAVAGLIDVTKLSVTGSIGDDVKIINEAVRGRNKLLDRVTQENKINRKIMLMEGPIRAWAHDEITQNPAALKGLQGFDGGRQEARFKANEGLRIMGRSLMELQGVLVTVLQNAKKGAANSITAEFARRKFVQKICAAAKEFNCPLPEAEVEEYLLFGNEEVLSKIRIALVNARAPAHEVSEAISIVELARSTITNFRVFLAMGKADLALAFMKATTATNIEVPDLKKGWFDAMLANSASHEAFVDLNVDDGTDCYLYVSKNGEPNFVSMKQCDDYENQDGVAVLRGLQDPQSYHLPTASLVYAHAYEESEILEAFSLLPEGGKVIVPVLCTNTKGTSYFAEANLIKQNNQLEYGAKKIPKFAPDIAAIRNNPCRYINASKLYFQSNGR